jgi:hypothetical protein
MSKIPSPILASKPAETMPVISSLHHQLSVRALGAIIAERQLKPCIDRAVPEALQGGSQLVSPSYGQVVSLGAIHETRQTGNSDKPERRAHPEGNVSQYSALPKQYIQDEFARTYHRAFVDAMYATITVMKMHFYGLGLPGPGIAGRLIPTPGQPAGLLVYTVGEMLASMKDRCHGMACIDMSGQFLEAMPLSPGESYFVAHLSCTMLNAQMQRRHNFEIDRALEAYEGTMDNKSLGRNQVEDLETSGVPATLERWLEGAKRRARKTGFLEQELPLNNNPATAAAFVHVGLVTRAMVENSRTISCLKVEATPEDVASSVVKLMEVALANGAKPVIATCTAQAYAKPLACDEKLDPTTTLKLLVDVENMTSRLERFEQENTVNQTTSQAKLRGSSLGMGSVAVGIPMDCSGAAEWGADCQELLHDREATTVDAQRAELLSEYSQRISQLEARLAVYDEQFAPLLESMASAAKQINNGTDARQRIELARKILRGETQSARKLVDFGYQLIAGTFEIDQTK